ncbi:MAG: apolipoprotein N-acyltransferase [Verrucomicrobiota bacterium]
MKKISIKTLLRNRYFFALLGGLMLAVSFPRFNVAGFAWIAPALILFSGFGKTPRQKFWIGYTAGLAHFLFALNWLLSIPFPAGAIAAWLALSGYLAVYLAIWVWLCWKIFSWITFTNDLKTFAETTWKQRALWSLFCAAIWVAFEMAMARVWSGFPWNFLATTQYKLTPLLQISSVTGVYGVSFLVVWFSVSLGCAGLLLVQKPQNRRACSAEIALPTLTIVLIFSFGFTQISKGKFSDRKIKVALIQPSIPQTLIFDESQGDSRFAKIMELSEQALVEKPDLLIWPEASTPPLDNEKFTALTNLVVRHQVAMILGADDSEKQFDSSGRAETNYFNSSFFIPPDARSISTYRKQHLVGFGEYVPLARWLPFMKWLTPIEGGFTAGPHPVQFQIAEPRAKTSVLICFEDAFPHYAREHVETDTDFLLNLTNDGWFGKRSAQWQQAIGAIFRAIENGLPLVRCTNDGLTCWIDQFGCLRKYFASQSGDIYGPGFLIAEIPLLNENEKRAPTFYRQHGDWFGWSCVVIASVLLIATWKRRSSQG